MLRITRIENESRGTPRGVTLHAEGRIVSEWVDVIQAECLRSLGEFDTVDLDLAGVTYVDPRAAVMLNALPRPGLSISNSTPLVRESLADIGPAPAGAALATLVARALPAVYQAALLLSACEAGAERLVLDAVARVTRASVSLLPGTDVGLWMLGAMARHSLQGAVEEAERGTATQPPGGERRLPTDDPTQARVVTAVRALPVHCRAAATLYLVAAAADREIAVMLRWPVARVRRELRRARVLLAAALREAPAGA